MQVALFQKFVVSKFSLKSRQKICFRNRSQKSVSLNIKKVFVQSFSQDPKIETQKDRTIEQAEKTEIDPIIEQQKQLQIKTTKILERLMKAGADMDKEAELMTDQFDPYFFQQTAAFIELARKDKDQNPLQNLLRCYRVAQKAKNKTLPPQIQLMNECLAAKKSSLQVLLENNEQVLWLDDEKFFRILDGTIVDFDNRKMFVQSNKLREVKKIGDSIRNKRK
eukprot:TRINITY_DN7534_c0_g1_i3.p2 TRINITY_DN7534_c0_g1~~TRINITY_DN7534_c0_g1_i3.p2  ORF type:complete len:222 (+),score=35.06 TRINITY_DN7534_c0_g1_i3:104-769(+)